MNPLSKLIFTYCKKRQEKEDDKAIKSSSYMRIQVMTCVLNYGYGFYNLGCGLEKRLQRLNIASFGYDKFRVSQPHIQKRSLFSVYVQIFPRDLTTAT